MSGRQLGGPRRSGDSLLGIVTPVSGHSSGAARSKRNVPQKMPCLKRPNITPFSSIPSNVMSDSGWGITKRMFPSGSTVAEKARSSILRDATSSVPHSSPSTICRAALTGTSDRSTLITPSQRPTSAASGPVGVEVGVGEGTVVGVGAGEGDAVGVANSNAVGVGNNPVVGVGKTSAVGVCNTLAVGVGEGITVGVGWVTVVGVGDGSAMAVGWVPAVGVDAGIVAGVGVGERRAMNPHVLSNATMTRPTANISPIGNL